MRLNHHYTTHCRGMLHVFLVDLKLIPVLVWVLVGPRRTPPKHSLSRHLRWSSSGSRTLTLWPSSPSLQAWLSLHAPHGDTYSAHRSSYNRHKTKKHLSNLMPPVCWNIYWNKKTVVIWASICCWIVWFMMWKQALYILTQSTPPLGWKHILCLINHYVNRSTFGALEFHQNQDVILRLLFWNLETCH